MKRKKSISLLMAFVMAASLLLGLNLGTQTAKADDGLVLHLKFDGDLTDASGQGNDGECTYGKISYEDGIFGKSAVFNGKSYIEIPDSDSLDLKQFTISLWVYKSTNQKLDKWIPYLQKENDENSWASPYQLYEIDDNRPLLYLHDTTDGTEMDQLNVMGNCIDVRKWFLLTVTYNGSEVRLYENDTLMKKVSVTGSPAATVGKLYVGMMDGKYFFNGKMDDLRIYNKSLTASQVAALYNDGLAAKPEFLTQTDALVAHYKFDGDYKDSSDFGNDAELVAGKVTFTDGKNNKAAKFAKGSYLEVPNNESLEFDQGFTMTAWINNQKKNTNMTLLHKTGPSTQQSSDDIALRFHIYEDYYDFNYVPFESQTSHETFRYTFDNNVNKWTHVAVTFDTQEIRWYVNGKQVYKQEVPDYEGCSLAHSDGSLMIGSDGKYYFQGEVDELKLYNYALSAKEVKKDYEQVDSLLISDANVKKISGLKAKDTVNLEVSRKYIETGKTAKLTSGVTFKSSNTKVFTVSKTGKLTAVKKGTATLTITHGAISKTYKVTVK